MEWHIRCERRVSPHIYHGLYSCMGYMILISCIKYAGRLVPSGVNCGLLSVRKFKVTYKFVFHYIRSC
jgi:hypothetical protein